MKGIAVLISKTNTIEETYSSSCLKNINLHLIERTKKLWREKMKESQTIFTHIVNSHCIRCFVIDEKLQRWEVLKYMNTNENMNKCEII